MDVRGQPKSTPLEKDANSWGGLQRTAAGASSSAVACQTLAAVRQYSVRPARGTEEFIEDTASQRWFQERIFDMFLWNISSRNVTSSVSEE